MFNIEEPEDSSDVTALGIDLGTTHSLIAISRNAVSEIIKDDNGNKLLLSTISFDDKIIVGKSGDDTISSIKRLMGKSFADLSDELKSLYKCSSLDGKTILIKLGNKTYNPVELSSFILQALKIRAEKYLNKPVTHAVITVPAYFDEAARNDTKLAAHIAGIKVLRLINEPTAASLAYNLDRSKDGIYLIYDLGGGTFDVSLLKMKEGVFQVLATSGDAMLGGDDFDISIINHFPSLNLSRKDAKFIKESLTTEEEINYRGINISRSELNQIIEPLISKTIHIMKNVVRSSEIDESKINAIVLVGGATRVKLVKEEISKNFAINILDDVNPDEIVALGAALQAENLTTGIDSLLLDVTSLSLGLELMGGIVEKVIARNSAIPISVKTDFTTYIDGQTAIKFHIVQGERELAKNCRSLASFELTNLPAKKAGEVKIEVTFTIDADGLLKVWAYEKETSQLLQIEISPSYGIDQNQVQSMILDAQINALDDVTMKILIEKRMEAELLIKSVSQIISDKKKFNDEIRKKINSSLEKLVNASQGDDFELIKHSQAELKELVTKAIEELTVAVQGS